MHYASTLNSTPQHTNLTRYKKRTHTHISQHNNLPQNKMLDTPPPECTSHGFAAVITNHTTPTNTTQTAHTQTSAPSAMSHVTPLIVDFPSLASLRQHTLFQVQWLWLDPVSVVTLCGANFTDPEEASLKKLGRKRYISF